MPTLADHHECVVLAEMPPIEAVAEGYQVLQQVMRRRRKGEWKPIYRVRINGCWCGGRGEPGEWLAMAIDPVICLIANFYERFV